MATRIINGRTAVDRAGAAELTGSAVPTIDYWYRTRDKCGFPERVPGAGTGAWWYAEDLQRFTAEHQAAKKATLTTVDRSGDPDELVDAPAVARILGYTDPRGLRNSSVWQPLLDHVADVELLPSGTQRRRWMRRTVWAIADARPGKGGGRRVGTARGDVDRSGDPDDLVGAPEAARVLGYSKAQLLPQEVLDRADDVTVGAAGRSRRKWRRHTLWAIADSWTS